MTRKAPVLFFVFTLLLLVGGIANAQTAKQRVLQNTDIEGLYALSKELFIEDSLDFARAHKLAKKHDWPLEMESENGFMQLVGVNENGSPRYVMSLNRNAARTISTDKVHNAGGLGYNLEGQNMIIGEWDGGGVRNTHQEFGNRVNRRDGASGTNSHATHVAGTLIASGVRASAKGMAPKATLWAYDWNTDGSEMASAAAQGLLVSNHSYGSRVGWSSSGNTWYWNGNISISAFEDYKFGYYDNRARDWDRMARMAPYYLIVKAAGNDRNDSRTGSHRYWDGSAWRTSSATRKKDGDYDCLPTYANAKNILLVGAVGDLTNGYSNPNGVAMTNFSAWGPTDDGRIKPDIVGNGLSVYSTTNNSNTSYGNSNGTSMAAPSVAGSCLLLQQHYNNENSRYMKSATLKALVIHTADEAGNAAGPDYKFGWGLMNTKKAVELISDNSVFIEERTLVNGNQDEQVVFSNGSSPITVTIAWTDIEGTVHAPALNSTNLKLVNDLDVRLVNINTGAQYFPYVLNPLVRAAAATKGNNVRDNVEKLHYSNIPAGNYYLRVSHKGALSGGRQDYSIIGQGFIDGPRADFTVSQSTLCAGDTVFMTDKSSNGVNAWQWTYTGATSSGSTQRNPYAIFSQPGNYSITLRALDGALFDTKTVNITVSDFPNAGIVEVDTAYCKSERNSVVLTPIEGNGKWDGGSWMVFIDSCKFRPSSLAVGDYIAYHTLTNQAGCADVDTVIVRIRENPTASLSLGQTDFCSDESGFIITGGSPNGGNYFINEVPNQRFDPKQMSIGSHKISYEYTDTNGCMGSTEQYVWVEDCMGISSAENNAVIEVFPNPFSNYVKLSNIPKGSAIRVTDVLGAEVAVSILEKEGDVVMDLPNCRKGVYFLSVTNDHYRFQTIRLLKE